MLLSDFMNGFVCSSDYTVIFALYNGENGLLIDRDYMYRSYNVFNNLSERIDYELFILNKYGNYKVYNVNAYVDYDYTPGMNVIEIGLIKDGDTK